MPKKRRPENKGLPKRWTFRDNAYYYRVPTGKEALWDGKQYFNLGKTLPEAYRKWADRIEASMDAKFIGELIDRYALEVIPEKKPKTRASNILSIVPLRSVFGQMKLSALKPQMVYQYVEKRSIKVSDGNGKVTGGKVTALRDIEVLSHAFTKAIEWGYIDHHPFKGQIRFKGTGSRTRYVEDWEVIECLSLTPYRKKGSVLAIQSYIRIKLLTGMSQYDLLMLRDKDLRADGIHIQRNKTKDSSGKRTIYEWSDQLTRAVTNAKEARPTASDFLFCNRLGKSYINPETDEAPGWKTMWQNFMKRVMAETEVEEHFTQHDLRAKCASDAATLEHARALLSHADIRTTERVYRRKPERVKPLETEIYEGKVYL